MDIAITKMSSKGQIVIPAEMREGFKEGDKIVIIKNGSQMILKKAEDLKESLKDDLQFAKKTEQAWKNIEKGKFIELGLDDFLKQAKK